METDDRGARLLRLAEAIADGTPIDWEMAGQADPENSDSFDALRALEAVVSAHGPVPDAAEGSIGERWGSLQIRAKIGEGSFGEVYRAYDPALEREIALKLLQTDRAKSERATHRFLEEARRLAKVRHPNVLVVHGADVHDGRAGMWTDLVRGRTLEQVLAHDGPMSAQVAALIGIDLCRALAAVHAADMIHRDVKTHNVMREEGGRIVLMDFGSVGVFSPGTPPQAGEAAYGTPLTVAPELLRGVAAGPATDLYSLGVLLYRLVTRRYPVEASSFSELTQKHDRGETVPLREARPDLPTDFVQAVERALDPDPRKRFGGPGAMERALAGCIPAPVADRSSGIWRAKAIRPRLRWIYGAAAVGLAIAAIVVMVPKILPPSPTGIPSHVSSPTPTPPSALAASARLYREKNGTSEPLMHGGRVGPGDALYLELEGSEPMNVYVLNEDEMGEVYVLFPLPGLDQANPLSPNTTHRLPGTRAGRRENWEVTSAGGNEDVFVIASREPLRKVEGELTRMALAEPGAAVRYRKLSQQTVNETFRGIGGTTAAAPTPATAALPSKLADLLGALANEPERGRNIWIWQTRLSNPSPSQ